MPHGNPILDEVPCHEIRTPKQKPATKPNKEPKLLRSRQPGDLSLEDWQRGLRRQFGREQAFGLENSG